jgi:hypothetical protein
VDGPSIAASISLSVRPLTVEMAKEPWTDPDPPPGDFDGELAAIDPRDIQLVESCSDAR